MEVRFYDTIDDSLLKFAVIISRSNGKWVFCKHKERDTYEVPGGHREAGESILETARRELQEETGAIKFDIKPICVYSVTGKNRVNNTGEETFGLLCFAEVTECEKELHSEMEKVVLMDELPENWTYPLIQPKLIEKYLHTEKQSMINSTLNHGIIREAKADDLDEILHLYLYLHEKSIPEESEQLRNTWESIINDKNHHLIVCEVDGKIVASCVCVIIPNLTRNVRPYAFVENVVTHADYRKLGYATDCLNYAKNIAKGNGCYKMMLLTGSKEESTLNFYRNAGYNSTDKTAFIQWIDM